MSVEALRNELAELLKKYGLHLTHSPEISMDGPPRYEHGYEGVWPIARTVDKYTMTIHAHVENPGAWRADPSRRRLS